MMGGFGGCCGTGWLSNFGGLGWFGMVINFLLVLAFLIGLVILTSWIVRRFRDNDPRSTYQGSADLTNLSPKEILAIRYARGEINRDEFQRMITDLG